MRDFENQKLSVVELRQSVFILGVRLVILEIILACIHLFILSASKFISAGGIISDLSFGFNTLILSLEFIFDAILMLIIFARWHSYIYILEKGRLSVRKGLIQSNRDSYSLKRVESITVYQGFIGKLFDIGSVEIFSPVWPQKVKMIWIPKPNYYARILQDFSEGSAEGYNVLRKPTMADIS